MNAQRIAERIAKILTECGDTVVLKIVSEGVTADAGYSAYQIDPVRLKRTNNCGPLNPPDPPCPNDSNNSYLVKRIILSDTIVNEYGEDNLSDIDIRSWIFEDDRPDQRRLFACGNIT